jgi:phage terminase large subunit
MHLQTLPKKKILERFRKDPVYHVEKVQGVLTLEPYQKDILAAVAQYERVSIAACHDVGKTFTMSKVVLWFTSTFRGAKVITTAPTYNQVKRLLWSEIRSGFSKCRIPLGGDMLLTEWKISDDWFAVGFTSRSEKTEGEGQGQASSFQGFHAPYILVVFDEATGIGASIWKQVEGLLTSGFVRFCAIGNPTTKACEFYSCFSNPAFKKIKLSCFDSPNFPANGIPDLEAFTKEYDRLRELPPDEQFQELNKYVVVNQHLITVKWVMTMALTWGIKHPLVVSKAFGEFPDEDETILISLGVVQAAALRTYEPTEQDRVSIGVDVARFGSDKTVITKIKGKQVIEKRVLIKRDTMHISGVVVNMIHEEPSHNIHIVVDATGLGSGVVDSLNESKSSLVIPDYVLVHEVHFGARPYMAETDPDEQEKMEKKYVNLKARMYVEALKALKEELCLIEDDEYSLELPTIKYKFDSKGRWQIESKDEYRARTGRASPDTSDSLVLANFGRTDAIGSGTFTQEMNQSTIKTISPSRRGQDLW